MRELYKGLTRVVYVLYNIVSIVPMISMWERRRELLVVARSPCLAILHGLAILVLTQVVLVQELLAQEGLELEDSVLIWATVLCLPTLGSCANLRANRVVVLSSQTHRKDALYGISKSFQRNGVIAGLLLGIILGIVIEILRFRGLSQNSYAYLGQPAVFFLVMIGLTTTPMVYSCRQLLATRDALRMGVELTRIQIAIYMCVLPYFVLLILNNYGVIHVSTRLQFLLVGLGLYMNIETFVISRPRWVRKRDRATSAVHVDADFGCISLPSKWSTSLDIIADGTLKPLYARYVELNLCWESFAFISDAVEYEQGVFTLNMVNENYHTFQKLLSTYIVPGSILEVNISSALRRPVTSCAKEEIYYKLSWDEQRCILRACVHEICNMLDFNLLDSFKHTKEYKIGLAEIATKGRMASSLDRLESELSTFIPYLQ